MVLPIIRGSNIVVRSGRPAFSTVAVGMPVNLLVKLKIRIRNSNIKTNPLAIYDIRKY